MGSFGCHSFTMSEQLKFLVEELNKPPYQALCQQQNRGQKEKCSRAASKAECRPREAIQNLERRAEKGQREYGSSFKAGETVDQLREIAGLQETLLRASQNGARNGNRSHRAGNRNSCIAINFLFAV